MSNFPVNTRTELIRIAVGSMNPVKLNSARQGIQAATMGTQCECDGFNATSGVPDQPVGRDDTLLGAKNRAAAAYIAYESKHGVRPDYGVGLEGGVSSLTSDTMECFAFCAIFNGEDFGYAQTATFLVPKIIADHIRSGMEMGDADDLGKKTFPVTHFEL
jgi:inosine/xanthosine triphosphatase